MPTYEFRCPKGHEFEKFYRSIGTAPAEVHCPECGALAERQLSGGAGLVFKGSGFYITDYGKDGKKDLRTTAPAKSESGSSEKSDSGSAKASDSGGSGASESKSGESKSVDSKSSAGSDAKSSKSESKSSGSSTESKSSSASSKKKDTK
jgi:putative FmdB family regulatory protein